MKTVEKEQLIEYVKNGIPITSEVFALGIILKNYTEACEKNKPVLIEKPLPEKPVEEPYAGERAAAIGMGIGGVFSIALALLLLATNKPDAFLSFCILVLFIIGVGFLAVSGSEWSYDKKRVRTNEARNREYENQKNRIEAENKQLQEKFRIDFDKWSESYAKGLKYLDSKTDELEKVIEEYFSVNIIFPKYRSLAALTSFYEYLSSGRCEELSGANGCYNLYESELRQDIIMAQLDTIINNLEQIKQNQYILYEELKKTEGVLCQISSELSAIKGLTFELTEIAALNMYYNSITASNASALAFLETIR